MGGASDDLDAVQAMTRMVLAQRAKAGARALVAGLYHASGAFRTRLRGKVAILTYHRVLTREELRRHYIQPGMYVMREIFEAQMRFVKEHFEVLSLSKLLDLWQRDGLDGNRAYCAVTFDDGWLDNYRHAYPVLRRLSIPATIFLATGLVGTEAWFWPDRLAYVMVRQLGRTGQGNGRAWLDVEIERAIRHWKRKRRAEIEQALEELGRSVGARVPQERVVVNWNEVEEMSANGISFGSHSVNHAILTREDSDAAWSEIHDSLCELRRRNVNYVPVFCYPNGDYSAEIIGQVKAAGYAAAVAGNPGWETLKPRDIFALRRIGVHNDVCRTVSLFGFHVSGVERRLRGMEPY